MEWDVECICCSRVWHRVGCGVYCGNSGMEWDVEWIAGTVEWSGMWSVLQEQWNGVEC